MELIYTKAFQKAYKHINHEEVRQRIQELILKIQFMPDIGKPLRYDYAGKRSVRMPPFRIIYSVENDKITLLVLEHRSRAYD